jgi:hypothetical protein
MPRLKVYDLATGTWQYAGGVDPVALATDAAFTSRYMPVPTPWTAPAFLSGWVNVGTPQENAGYRKIGDMVFLRGSIKSGTLSNAAFQLSAAFQPPKTLMFTCVMAPAGATLGAVYVNGVVAGVNAGFVTPYTGANTEVHLDGISYSTV